MLSAILISKHLNPKVDTPPFAATVTITASLQLYQVDPVHQPWGLSAPFIWVLKL